MITGVQQENLIHEPSNVYVGGMLPIRRAIGVGVLQKRNSL
jgi:hypothetical protein